MPTLEHGGPWSVWDVKGLRPNRGRERVPAQPSTASVDGRAWPAAGRLRPTGEDASGHGRHATPIDEREEVLRFFLSGELTTEEAAHVLGNFDRSEAGARVATGAAGKPASAPRS